MLLQRLVEYAERSTDIPPAMYNLETIKYWIELTDAGEMKGIVTVEPEDGTRLKRVSVPSLVRTVAVKAKLLADNGEYVLGVGRPDSKPARVAQAHLDFVDLTRRCAEETDEPDVRAVLRFLEGLPIAAPALPADFDPTGGICFAVEGRRPTELRSVQEFWKRAGAEGKRLQCLVCGQERPAVERLQVRLKGMGVGQTSGLALISANADAYESYGLGASYIAPTCLSCSDLFMKGANQLIAGETTHLRLGDSMYIFWTRDVTPFSPRDLLSRPEPDQVRHLLSSVFRRGVTAFDPTPFYAAALGASGARAVVRDWIDTTVGQAQGSLARFFQLQRIVDTWAEGDKPLGVYSLAAATVRPGSKDAPSPWIFKSLVRCALHGGSLPASLLFKAVERCRAERGVNQQRAALIKMVLLSRADTKGDEYMVRLDVENREPAYLCGRLFAELEAAQYAAMGEVGATIVDRFYGTASSAPATVFARLIRGAQPHLGKLRRERPGAYHALDSRLGDIMADLPSFPTTLDLERQALFALGYYHQRAADRQASRDHRAKGGTASEQIAVPDTNTIREEES